MKGPLSNPWPWGIVIGLGIVVLANVIMLHFAITRPSAPASLDHYAESARWDEVQAERGRSQALGWHVVVHACSSEGCTLHLEVTDTEGAPVLGLKGRLQAQRSDDPALDREGEVAEGSSPGEYRSHLALARPGLYTVSIRLEGGAAPWVDQRRVRVFGEP